MQPSSKFTYNKILKFKFLAILLNRLLNIPKNKAQDNSLSEPVSTNI